MNALAAVALSVGLLAPASAEPVGARRGDGGWAAAVETAAGSLTRRSVAATMPWSPRDAALSLLDFDDGPVPGGAVHLRRAAAAVLRA
ncbi:MAG: hypothetical protein SF051_07525, partial [Elusimicrobiota bacterium]|nr:hypothetical protein [Elusimicrobiota bacterium]